MRFYTQQHQYYCGIDLHARAMCLSKLLEELRILHLDILVNQPLKLETSM